jgi:hypothetical protein
VSDISRFPSGRHLANYIGLKPREYSSGLRTRLARQQHTKLESILGHPTHIIDAEKTVGMAPPLVLDDLATRRTLSPTGGGGGR